jgi:hypothetical protein
MTRITTLLLLLQLELSIAFIKTTTSSSPFNSTTLLYQGHWYIKATNDPKFQDAKVDIRRNRFAITIYKQSIENTITTKIIREGKFDQDDHHEATLAFLQNKIFLHRLGDITLPETCSLKTVRPKILKEINIYMEDR